MQIDSQQLYDFLGTPRIERGGFPKKGFGNVVRITRRFYCTPLNIAGNCPRDCQLCQVTIVTEFDGLTCGNVKNPPALWAWKLKRLVGNLLEQKQAARKVEIRTTDAFGTRDTSNVFDALLEGVA